MEEIKPAMKEVEIKIKAKEEPKNHKISKVVLQMEKVYEQKQANEEDLKESAISDVQLSTTHKMVSCFFKFLRIFLNILTILLQKQSSKYHQIIH